MGRRLGLRGMALAVLLALAPSAGCRAPEVSPGEGARVSDDAGREVPLAPAPRRIVSLLPSATELLLALGAADRLVARTGYDTQTALAHLPSLGRTLAPELESVQALRPDLVLAPSETLAPGVASRLRALGTRVFEVDAQRLDEVLSTTRRVATLVGEPRRGDSLSHALERELDALAGALAGAEPVDALYLVWHSPPLVAGRGTYVDDLLAAAGGRNVFSDVLGWAEVSLEEVVERDPRYLVVPRGEGHSLQPGWLVEEAGWRSLRAVREGRMLVVDSDLFNRPGPAVAEAAWTLARGLHGQLERKEAPR